MAGYLITNLAVFMAVIAFYNRTGNEEIADFRGLAETQPVPRAGHHGGPVLARRHAAARRLRDEVHPLPGGTAQGGYLWLVAVAVTMSTVSLYYYLQVIRHMYLFEPVGDTSRWRLSTTGYLVTGVLIFGTVAIGIQAGPVYEMADRAVAVLFV